MARYNLKSAGMSGMMISLLNQRIPALPALYDAVVGAGTVAQKATNARKDADAELKAAGLDGESLFGIVKKAAVELAFADNGDCNPRGIEPITVKNYFTGRLAAEGKPENTGTAYANLAGQLVAALIAGDLTPDVLAPMTRPEVQTFLAAEDAAARSKVKAEFGELVKGGTAEYCRQLSDHLATFQYERPDGDYGQSDVRWTGRKLPKPRKGEKPTPADTGDADASRAMESEADAE